MKQRYIVCMVTASSADEGARIGKKLVSEGLAACCNIVGGVRSIYTWQGKLSDEAEVLCIFKTRKELIFKTRKELFGRLKKRVKELHSYDVPEVIALAIDDGLEEYLEWIDSVTG
jgi:periplasmic divalent cation tolerance protein